MAETPRIFHFVFGLRPQNEPFHLAYFLCLESCRRINRPDAIFFHYRHLPYGPWWDRIVPHLTLRRVEAVPTGFDPACYRHSQEGVFIERAGLSYAHEADFIRLDQLVEHGGVYADMDTLFVRPYPDDLYRHECVLGEEPPSAGPHGILRPSLCNAVILAHPQARFLRRWRQRSEEVFDGSWSRHSCQEAARLWFDMPGAVHVAPQRRFYRFGLGPASFTALFNEFEPDLRGVCSLHLWAHLWWSRARTDFSDFHEGLLTERYVLESESTYARLARPFLLPETTEARQAPWPATRQVDAIVKEAAARCGSAEAGRGKRKLVLFYNFPWDLPVDFPCEGLPDGYVLTTDRRCLGDAAGVVFHLPTLHVDKAIDKGKGQLWVGWSMECEAHYPGLLDNPAIMRHFDLAMTYRRDVVTTYVGQNLHEQLRRPAEEKSPGNLVNAFISSRYDASGRVAYLKALMRHLDVHSYGGVLNNRAIELDTGRQTKLAIIAKYPFTLAFENAIARDCVTEKFFDPLIAGSVPVYLGAPNIEDFAPGDHCYIDAGAFPDPEDLARHLLAIANDAQVYQRYLDWKAKPYRASFLRLLDQEREHPFIRLCRRIEEMRPD